MEVANFSSFHMLLVSAHFGFDSCIDYGLMDTFFYVSSFFKKINGLEKRYRNRLQKFLLCMELRYNKKACKNYNVTHEESFAAQCRALILNTHFKNHKHSHTSYK